MNRSTKEHKNIRTEKQKNRETKEQVGWGSSVSRRLWFLCSFSRARRAGFFVLLFFGSFVGLANAQPPLTQAESVCRGEIRVLADVFNFFTCALSRAVIPVLFSLASVVFIWGVIQYIMGANDQTKREEGRKFIIWGIVGLFVITAIWGIVGILGATVGTGGVSSPPIQNPYTPF